MLPSGMGWSWFDLTGEPGGTPVYVRRFCVDLLNIKRRCEAAALERARNQRNQHQG